MNKKLKIALRLIFGLAVLGVLIAKIGIKDILIIFPTISWWYLLLALPFFIFFIILSAVCINILIRPYKEIKFKTLVKYYIYAWTMGLFFPGKLGEFSLAYFLKKHDVKIGDGLAVTLLDKLLTLVFFFIIVLPGVFIVFPYKIAFKLFIGIISLILILLIGLFFLIKGLFRNWLPKKFRSHFDDLIFSLRSFFKNRKNLLYYNLAITSIRWITDSIMTFFVFLSLGVIVNLFSILIISIVAAAVSLIPISINGLGIRQAAVVFLYSVINIDSAVVINMCLIRLSFIYLTAAVFFLLFMHDGMRGGLNVPSGL